MVGHEASERRRRHARRLDAQLDAALRAAPRGGRSGAGDASTASTITSSSPEYEGRHGVRVLERATPALRATVRVRLAASDGALELTITNVRRLAISGAAARAALASGGALRIDGDGVSLKGEACAAEEHATTPTECCRNRGGSLGGWHVCASPALRPPHLLGPIRRVFAAPWVVVVADDASALEVRLASYVVSGHQPGGHRHEHARRAAGGRGGTAGPSHRFVFLGVHAHRRFTSAASTAAWPVAALQEGSLAINGCTFGGLGVAAAFIAPSSAAAPRLISTWW